MRVEKAKHVHPRGSPVPSLSRALAMSPPTASGAAPGTAPTPSPFLFVYGTLRRSYMLLPHQLRRMRPPHVLDTHGEWVGTGVLRGHQLWDVGTYPGVVKGEAGDPVIGDVFRVPDSYWEGLDRYEGIAPEYTTPQEYTREVRVALWKAESLWSVR